MKYTEAEVRRTAEALELGKLTTDLLVNYVMDGVELPPTLGAIAKNDLAGAVYNRDEIGTIEDVESVSQWFDDQTPPDCHGTVSRVLIWIGGDGLDGLEKRRSERQVAHLQH